MALAIRSGLYSSPSPPGAVAREVERAKEQMRRLLEFPKALFRSLESNWLIASVRQRRHPGIFITFFLGRTAASESTSWMWKDG